MQLRGWASGAGRDDRHRGERLVDVFDVRADSQRRAVVVFGWDFHRSRSASGLTCGVGDGVPDTATPSKVFDHPGSTRCSHLETAGRKETQRAAARCRVRLIIASLASVAVTSDASIEDQQQARRSPPRSPALARLDQARQRSAQGLPPALRDQHGVGTSHSYTPAKGRVWPGPYRLKCTGERSRSLRQHCHFSSTSRPPSESWHYSVDASG